ncbi:uncharacterized protein E0L32_000445 [Thyridium curvatum]|uniref:Major facilitator superfamily (MFS) profile domain-containing protein n=1 Tax=Thyridium curvatum TaxID=1093900 RepID=A0A507BAF6_9PEZI|nr:uncharacterized protein E0L32_000445 [Thyridium curvatum]TPX14051.1 hypothetical protein E0L32_000445 [Thyridium curvatum]
MESALLRSLVTVESSGPDTLIKVPTAPAKAHSRICHADNPQRGMSIDLDRITRPATHSGSVGNNSGPTTPSAEIDLEMSCPGTPIEMDVSEPVQSMWDPHMNSAAGALIPYMEKYYNIGYGIVSLIFVGNAFGFIFAAVFLDALKARLGSGKVLALSQVIIASGYVVLSAAAPFPAVVVAFFLLGFGMSISIANSNTFAGGLTNGTTMLGFVHGSYGLGGTVGPLIATALVTQARVPWSRYYLITLGLTVLNFFLAGWAFWSHEKEVAPPPQLLDGAAAASSGGSSSTSSIRQRNAPAPPPPATSQLFNMLSAFTSRLVFLGSLFIFAYQGAEVSISGWVISFLITFRGGAPSSVGYVTAGFWAGIAIGRLALTTPAQRVGEKRFVYGVTLGAAVLELLVWWVPNVVGDAVAVAVVGLLLGPVYPCATAIFIRSMSRREKMSGLGVIAAFGSSGGAAAPFTTGMLAQAVGTWVLHPIAVALFAVMILCWFMLPEPEKRDE